MSSGGFFRDSEDWMATPRFSDFGDGGGYVMPRGPGDLLRDCHEGESAGLLLLLLHGKDDDVGMEAEAAAAAADSAAAAVAADEASPVI